MSGDRVFTLEPTGEFLTRSELERQSARFIHGLRTLGATPENGAVVWLLDNCLEFVIMGVSAERAGYDFLALNTHCTPEEVVSLIATLNPGVLVTSAKQLGRRGMAEALQGIDSSIVKILIDESAGDWLPYPTPFGAQYGSWAGIEAAHPGRMLLLSGGSSGTPKVVVHQGAPHETINNLTSGQGEVQLIAQPFYHTGPFTIMMKALKAGGRVVAMRKWNTLWVLRAIERHCVTHAFFVPTMMSRLLNLPEDVRNQVDLSSLRLVIHGAAPCPVSVKWAWLDWMPEGCVTVDGYGSTEDVGMTVATDAEWRERPGTVGRPIGCRIVIRDRDGNRLPVGKIGVVWFAREDNKRMHYLDNPEETSRSYHEWEDGILEGTVHDLGRLDKDGYLFLEGRDKDMIICGGANVYPIRTEDVLCGHPAVADAVALSIPDEDWGEALTAVVQLKEGFEASDGLKQELIALCHERLDGFHSPKSITIATLPRRDTGKINKSEVRALVTA